MRLGLKILPLVLLLCHSAVAQERWWRFVNGWTAGKSIELDDGSFLTSGISYQLDKDSVSRESMEFTRLSSNGDSLDNWYIRIDTFEGRHISANEVSLQQSLILFRKRILVGSLFIYGDTYDAYIMELDSSLHKPRLFKKIRDNADRKIIHSFLNNQDTELLVLGNYHMATRDVNYTFLTALDSNLNVKWEKQYTIGTREDLVSNQIIQDGRGGYLISCGCVGYDKDGYPNTFSQILIRVDKVGNELWRLPFRNDSLSFYDLKIASVSNDEFLGFYTDNDYNGSVDPNGLQQGNDKSTMWVTKFNLAKKIIWKKDLGQLIEWKLLDPLPHKCFAKDIVKQRDNSVVLTGFYYAKHHSAFLLKIDSAGTGKWARSYDAIPSNNADIIFNHVFSITQTRSNGFLLTGEYYSTEGNIFNETTQKGLVIRVDSIGCLEGGCDKWDGIQENKPKSNFSIYPNPVQRSLYISRASQTITSIRIYDLSGRVVMEEKEPKFPLDVSALPTGLYLLQVHSKEGVLREKFFKE